MGLGGMLLAAGGGGGGNGPRDIPLFIAAAVVVGAFMIYTLVRKSRR
jgi:hypothetical protein